MKDEYLLPDIISEAVGKGKAVLRWVDTDERWFGVTYPDDKAAVVESIRKMVSSGRYPEDLWA